MMITNEIKNKVNELKVEQGFDNATIHMNKVLHSQVELDKVLEELKELTLFIGTEQYDSLPHTVSFVINMRLITLNSKYDELINYIEYQYSYLMSYIN